MRRFFLITIMLLGTDTAYCENPWISLAKPTTHDLIRVFFIDSTNGWVAGDSGTIMRTTNAGGSWTPQRSEISRPIHEFFMLNHTRGWALAFQDQVDTSWFGTMLLKTSNGGESWARQDFPNDFFYALVFLDSMNGLLGGAGGKILRTSDGGTTWLPPRVDSSFFAYFPIRHFKFYSHDYGFAFGGQLDITGITWRTFDGGQKWTAFQASNEPIHGLHYIDSLNLITVSGDFDAGSNMAKSKSGGEEWDYIYLGIWGEARTLSFRTPQEGWCPLGFAGTYMVTTDTGRTWTQFNSPDGSAILDAMYVDSTRGFMVGANGTILSYKHSSTGIAEQGTTPMVHTLHQNFPNPFNPATVIPYELAEVCNVVVTVYDVAGRKVRTLVQGRQESGVHEVRFDGAGLGSGVYYYELTSESSRSRTTQIRKMTLIR